MAFAANVIVTGSSDVDDVLVKRQTWVERHSKQLDGVSELHVSSCDPHSLWLVDLRQPLACTENHSFSLGRILKQRILNEPSWHFASAAFYVRQSSKLKNKKFTQQRKG